jgi:HlyD family secretion protein
MSHRQPVLVIATFAMLGAGAGAIAYLRQGAEAKAPIPGMVRQTEIRIASETTGRLASLAVTRGQHVRKGELLAVIDNTDLAASVGEAKAAATSAKADRDRVYAGVRAEEVAMAREAVRTA